MGSVLHIVGTNRMTNKKTNMYLIELPSITILLFNLVTLSSSRSMFDPAAYHIIKGMTRIYFCTRISTRNMRRDTYQG